MIAGSGRDALGGLEEFLARRMIRHTRLPGLLRLALLAPTARRAMRKRTIVRARVRADDGSRLDTWVLRAESLDGPASRGAVVFLHGLWESKAQIFDLARHAVKRGFDAVLPDMRAHGLSGGTRITFGAVEKHDVRTIVDRLSARRLIAGPIYVAGFSLGGGIAVQYAALDARCRGAVVLGPVADARLIMRHMLRFWAPWIPDDRARRIIARAAELGGFDPNDASAVTAAAAFHGPIVVAHGAWDLTVPPSHGRAICQAAAGEARFVPLRRRGHASALIGRGRWFADQLDRMANGTFVENRPTTHP